MPSESESPIHFFTEGLSFKLFSVEKTQEWLIQCAGNQGFTVASLNYIFCKDPYLLEINQQYLDHDTYTDIITFDYSSNNLLNGEIYISLDRVKDNAAALGYLFNDELHRVMVHGLLHLMGLKDKTPEEEAFMRSTEDFCLNLRTF